MRIVVRSYVAGKGDLVARTMEISVEAKMKQTLCDSLSSLVAGIRGKHSVAGANRAQGQSSCATEHVLRSGAPDLRDWG